MTFGIVILIFAALIIGPLIGGAFHTSAHTGKFRDLGNIKGKPISDIVKEIGPATSISAIPNGTLYQWIYKSGFNASHHAISVDENGNAIGYTHQAVS